MVGKPLFSESLGNSARSDSKNSRTSVKSMSQTYQFVGTNNITEDMIEQQRSSEKLIDPRTITKPSNYTLNMQYKALQADIEKEISSVTSINPETKEGI